MISRTRLGLALLAAAGTLACSSNDSSTTNPCAGVTDACVGFPEATSADAISAALATAADGTTFVFGPGRFVFTNLAAGELDVTAANITIRGAGRHATVLDFGGHGTQGILATGDHFTLEDLDIIDSGGNGVKVLAVDYVTIRNVHVSWSSDDLDTHGGYGIYPVQSHHVLVEDCFTSGANDTGVYIGQSQDVIARNNESTGNVAGLEIENCFDADVHDNYLHGNTGGILVFDLPTLAQQGGHGIRVFDNHVIANNHFNFAPDLGSTLAMVPAGAGITIMANHDVEVFGNLIQENQSTGVSVISYMLTGQEITDPNYYPFPSNIDIHDNIMVWNGTSPDVNVPLGGALAQIQAQVFGGSPLPDVIWDGIPLGGGENPNMICAGSTHSWLSLGTYATGGDPPIGFVPSVASGPYRCSDDLAALPPVTPW